MSSSVEGVIEWEYAGYGGLWCRYGTELSKRLEDLYQIHLTQPDSPHITFMQFQLDSLRHRCCVKSMYEQIGNEISNRIPIRRVHLSGPMWHWFDGQIWLRYEDDISKEIEEGFQMSLPRVYFRVLSHHYFAEFNTGVNEQVNIRSGMRRPIARVVYSNRESVPEEMRIGIEATDLSLVYRDTISRNIEFNRGCSGEELTSERDEDDSPLAVDELLVDVKLSDVCNQVCLLCLQEFTCAKLAFRLCHCQGHFFHEDCGMGTTVVDLVQRRGFCPVCKHSYGVTRGNQPEGEMTITPLNVALPGHEEHSCVRINFRFPSGRQRDEHPNPGDEYEGVDQIAYLPDSGEGRRALTLMKKAWRRRLLFTIGYIETRRLHGITLNGVHIKTSCAGGPAVNGYPDPAYLERLISELNHIGVF